MRPFNDSVIYFAVVDRFYNGNSGNDKGFSQASFDASRSDWFKYWGGDLNGVIQKLDYLKDLGCSAVWLTPLFDQADGLVDVEGRGMAGYHGYWAKDFKRLDEHLAGSPEDVRVFASNDTVVDRLVKKLAAVRRENKAVQSGSHRRKHLSADVYAYTRVYRGSCCLAVFNRGAETTINLEGIELPDGVHKDVLSDRGVSVKAGRIKGLKLERDSSFVLSYCASVREKAGLEISFLLNGYNTAFGERVKVTGNCPELGNWDLSKAFPLEYINANMWLGHLPVKESAGKAIAYKFIVEKDNDGALYENRPAHVRLLPAAGSMEQQHRWS